MAGELPGPQETQTSPQTCSLTAGASVPSGNDTGQMKGLLATETLKFSFFSVLTPLVS